MEPNPFLKKLGFSSNDRVVIFHADDVGMCHSSIPAFQELFEQGSLTSGATMVPCAWFPAVAAYCRQHPKTDMGVHLTFTSEWESYRWGPLSTTEVASGLIDEEGYFYRTTAEVQKYANSAYIQNEVMAQIERALQAGIDVTHIDMHMGAMQHPKFLPPYIEAGRKYQIPMLAPRLTEERLKQWDNPKVVAKIKQVLHQIEAEGFPIIDHFRQMPLSKSIDDRLMAATHTLETLEPGLTHFIVHPTKDTAEIRAITPDWPARVADYHTFIHDELGDYITKSPLQVIGYRQLREAMRSN